MMAGAPLSADPGVAVRANAENATADPMAILPIVFNLTIKSLLCCKQSSPAHDRLRAVLVYDLAMSSLTELRLRETGRERKCMHPLCK
jgi:hypothetical protein